MKEWDALRKVQIPAAPEWQTKPLYTKTDLNSDPPKIANPVDWPLQDLLRCIWNDRNQRTSYVAALVSRVIAVAPSAKKSALLLNEIYAICSALDAERKSYEIQADEREKRDKRRKKKKKSKA